MQVLVLAIVRRCRWNRVCRVGLSEIEGYDHAQVSWLPQCYQIQNPLVRFLSTACDDSRPPVSRRHVWCQITDSRKWCCFFQTHARFQVTAPELRFYVDGRSKPFQHTMFLLEEEKRVFIDSSQTDGDDLYTPTSSTDRHDQNTWRTNKRKFLIFTVCNALVFCMSLSAMTWTVARSSRETRVKNEAWRAANITVSFHGEHAISCFYLYLQHR